MKYKLTANKKDGLTRIQALKDIPEIGVKSGDLGGWIQIDSNLSQEGNCWVSGNARVSCNASVSGNVWVSGNAKVYDYAVVYGNAKVSGEALVYGNAKVSGEALVYGNAIVCENQHIKYSKLTTDLSFKQNLNDSIRVQCNLPVLEDEKGEYVLGFKHVLKTEDLLKFKSKHDPLFLYTLYQEVNILDAEISNVSCASGLHFSNLSYWESKGCDTVLMVKCYISNIITIQEGKIRCKKLEITDIVKNGIE